MRFLWHLLLRLFGFKHHHPRYSMKIVEANFGNYSIKGNIMALALRADQSVTLTAAIVDRFGNATVTADPIGWAASSPNVSLTPSADGLTCEVTPTGAIGATTVSATAGSLTGSVDLDVTAGTPVSLTVTAGTPVDVPA